MGYKTTASGAWSTAMGAGTKASSYYATAMGSETHAAGNASIATGTGTLASGHYSFAGGDNSKAAGTYSFAMGVSANATGNCSTAIGNFARAIGDTQFVIGKNNATDSNSAFIIGNGSGNTYSNALTVDWSGNVTASGHVYSKITDWSSLNFSNSVASSGSVWAHKCGKIVWVHGFHYLTGTGGNIVTLPWNPIEDISIPVQADASGGYLCGYMDLIVGNNTNPLLKTGTTMVGYNRYSFTYMTNDT